MNLKGLLTVTIHINYLYIKELDQVIFNPLNLEQDKNSNDIDSFITNMGNMPHTFSNIFLYDVKTKLSEADVFLGSSMNIRSLANILQILIHQCLTDTDTFDTFRLDLRTTNKML